MDAISSNSITPAVVGSVARTDWWRPGRVIREDAPELRDRNHGVIDIIDLLQDGGHDNAPGSSEELARQINRPECAARWMNDTRRARNSKHGKSRLGVPPAEFLAVFVTDFNRAMHRNRRGPGDAFGKSSGGVATPWWGRSRGTLRCRWTSSRMKRKLPPVAGGGGGGSGEVKRVPCSWPVYSLVSTVAVACYLNGLNGDFVHDDIPAVTLNKDVLAVNHLGHVFKDDFWGTPMADVTSHKSYRPLTVMTFRWVYRTCLRVSQNQHTFLIRHRFS